jgi:hypothetical protein
MLALRFPQRLRSLSVALFAISMVFAFAVPVRADEVQTSSAARAVPAKRVTTSLGNPQPPPPSTPLTTQLPGRSFTNGFLYFPGAQTGMNIGGRVNVGKSHVYVPYYGTISNDPTHPGVQGTAGLAYGFRTWDISVFNGGFGTPQTPAIPGADAPKVNPALSLSIRF